MALFIMMKMEDIMNMHCMDYMNVIDIWLKILLL